MAKKTTATKKPIAEIRKEHELLLNKMEKFKEGAYCYMCDTHKQKMQFYISTNPLVRSGVTPICKKCALDIAMRIDKNGEYHSPTKESIQLALRYLDKPFLDVVYNASIQEQENDSSKTATNVWASYIRIIAMPQYNGMTYANSDFLKEKVVYEDEKDEDYLKQENMTVYSQYIKDKNDTLRLLHYDPFEKESVDDQPSLYSQMLGLLDSSEDANDDMLRTFSIISIVRCFLQSSKLDDAISRLMSDPRTMERNAGAIKSLQESKQKITAIITSLAAENCISLKNNKNAKKGENTWTGKIKKIKDLNIRSGEVNGFDMATCKAMRQIMDASNSSILKALRLDESEYADMIADMRETIVELRKELENYKEITRILLRENLDLKDTLREHELLIEENLTDLEQLFSCFGTLEAEDGE